MFKNQSRNRKAEFLHMKSKGIMFLISEEPGGSVVKNLPANAGGVGDPGSIPGLGRSPGGGNGNLLQYSCLENLMDRGAWQATVHGVAESRTRLHRHALMLRQKGRPRVNSKGKEPQRDVCTQWGLYLILPPTPTDWRQHQLAVHPKSHPQDLAGSSWPG